MTTPSTNLKQPVLCFWNSFDKHIRDSWKQGGSHLCFASPRWESIGHKCPLNILGHLGIGMHVPSSPIILKTREKIENSRCTTLIASQNPSRPWHPLVLNLSIRPHTPLKDVQFQFLSHLWQLVYHQEPACWILQPWYYHSSPKKPWASGLYGFGSYRTHPVQFISPIGTCSLNGPKIKTYNSPKSVLKPFGWVLGPFVAQGKLS